MQHKLYARPRIESPLMPQTSKRPALTKINSRSTVGDNVYEQLRQALMWGRFEPGQLITIDELSQQLGTSHMPVREALRRLSAENGLEITRTGTAKVPETSRERLDDLCRARAEIEGLAVELATARVGAADLDRLDALVQDHQTKADLGQAQELQHVNQLFHFGLYELAGSDVLSQFISVLWLQMGPYMRLLAQNIAANPQFGLLPAGRDLHLDIMRAMRAGDGKAARSALAQDIGATQKILQSLCEAKA